MRHSTDISVDNASAEAVLQTRGNPSTTQPTGVRSIYARFAKRPLDILAVILVLPIVLPVVLILAFFVMRQGGKPFYSQMRVGRSGRNFRLWKLRTMVHDADKRLEEYLATDPAARAEWDSTQKLKKDPRITSFGHFLRKTSLDELPQLWNVFSGDMSIVGPRPMMVEQAQLYPGADYYHLRPGVTGLWQISDRNDSTFAARATYDAEYARDLSFTGDASIIARTVGVVLRCTGY
ncbi:sugar transferase [Paracoccus sulfuroxidans]|uniref:Lipopolysaccharide/colanic/teichoic acid biosynthesis glycosyltransferase n=1 Tax=Paracoccus sulfuroxidans TaxID=384678 RepID=A0A562NU12_9RHOB|nr:sugar transferase [Paracoccus sulfuroxidans]TWI35708.1 lipopolysaccharide/colanic/teichoic acid biosynthesis glycosyltransferase [Paracoccus sulfuroxidans]